MRKYSPLTLLAISFLLVSVTILASMHSIDAMVASEIWHLTSSLPKLHKHILGMHDALPALSTIVVTATMLMCLGCIILFFTDRQDTSARCIKLAAIVIPTAFLAKKFLQYAFGRTYIRLWLQKGGPIEFKWFNPIESGGFPSGHMLVLTSFLTAVWLYYPRLRPLVATLLLVLAASLLFTSYHFVSDIIAGGYCGILITIGVDHFLKKPRRR